MTKISQFLSKGGFNITSLPRRKARAKTPQQPKILGSRTKESHTPPVATLKRRGPQISMIDENSKDTFLECVAEYVVFLWRVGT